MIRDVPPAQTPIPVLAERTRRQTGDLFAQTTDTETTREPTVSTIIEVPPWLARLEPALAAAERDERTVVEEQSEQAGRTPDDPPARQQELF